MCFTSMHVFPHSCFKCKERMGKKRKRKKDLERKGRRKEEREIRTCLTPLGQECMWASFSFSPFFLCGNIICTTNGSEEEASGEREAEGRNKQPKPLEQLRSR